MEMEMNQNSSDVLKIDWRRVFSNARSLNGDRSFHTLQPVRSSSYIQLHTSLQRNKFI